MQLSDIRDSARSKSDEQTTGFISNTELDRFINQGQNFIYGKIVQRFEDYFIAKGTSLNGGLITTVASQQSYDLPTNLIKVVRVEQRPAGSTDDNQWRKVDRGNIGNDRVDDFYPLREGYVPGFAYFIAGNQLHLRPVPSQIFSLRLWFIPRATALVNPTDTPTLPEEYHELIAEYGAIQNLRKSGESIWKEAMDIFNIELANLLETIEMRDQNSEQMLITDDSDYIRYGV